MEDRWLIILLMVMGAGLLLETCHQNDVKLKKIEACMVVPAPDWCNQFMKEVQ